MNDRTKGRFAALNLLAVLGVSGMLKMGVTPDCISQHRELLLEFKDIAIAGLNPDCESGFDEAVHELQDLSGRLQKSLHGSIDIPSPQLGGTLSVDNK